MNGILDWEAFAFKFRGDPQIAFETLAYHMFCRKYHITEGLPSFYNQKHIETNPYYGDGGSVVGFQAKYYSTPSITATQKNDLIKAIEGASSTYEGINLLYFYLSRPFSQSSSKGETKTGMQTEVEERADDLGIKIKWVVPSNFEKILNEPEYADLREYFFEVNKQELSSAKNILSRKDIPELMRRASISQREEIFKGNNKFNGLEIFEDLIPFAVSEKH